MTDTGENRESGSFILKTRKAIYIDRSDLFAMAATSSVPPEQVDQTQTETTSQITCEMNDNHAIMERMNENIHRLKEEVVSLDQGINGHVRTSKEIDNGSLRSNNKRHFDSSLARARTLADAIVLDMVYQEQRFCNRLAKTKLELDCLRFENDNLLQQLDNIGERLECIKEL